MSLPLLLSRDFSFSILFWGSVIPLTGYHIVRLLIFEPYRKKLLRQKLDYLREAHAELLEKQKSEALEAQTIMRPSVLKKVEEERATNGLVVVEALYGRLDHPNDYNVADVSIAVMNLVHNSELHIPNDTSKV